MDEKKIISIASKALKAKLNAKSTVNNTDPDYVPDEEELFSDDESIDEHTEFPYGDSCNVIEPIRQDNTHLQVSIPVQADTEEVASKVSIPLEASISPQVMCMKAYDGLHVYALSKDPDIFSIKNTHGYEEAIRHSVSESRKRMTELQNEEGIRDGQYHWTDEITNSYLQDWITMISVQGVFDLGCKHPLLPCYCPFQKPFSSYIDEI